MVETRSSQKRKEKAEEAEKRMKSKSSKKDSSPHETPTATSTSRRNSDSLRIERTPPRSRRRRASSSSGSSPGDSPKNLHPKSLAQCENIHRTRSSTGIIRRKSGTVSGCRCCAVISKPRKQLKKEITEISVYFCPKCPGKIYQQLYPYKKHVAQCCPEQAPSDLPLTPKEMRTKKLILSPSYPLSQTESEDTETEKSPSASPTKEFEKDDYDVDVVGDEERDQNLSKMSVDVSNPVDQNQSCSSKIIGQDQGQDEGQDSVEDQDQDSVEDQDQDPVEDQDQDPAEDQDQDPVEDRGQDPVEDQDHDPVEDQDQDSVEGQVQDSVEDQGQDPVEDQGQYPVEDQDQDPRDEEDQDQDPGDEEGQDQGQSPVSSTASTSASLEITDENPQSTSSLSESSTKVNDPIDLNMAPISFPPVTFDANYPEETPEDNLAYIIHSLELNQPGGLFFEDKEPIFKNLESQFLPGQGESSEVDELFASTFSILENTSFDENLFDEDIWHAVAQYAFSNKASTDSKYN